jgi:transmembrane sensor
MNSTDAEIRSAIIARAAEWLAAHRAGALDHEQRTAFFAWLTASPLHVEEYLAIVALERDLAVAADDESVSWEKLLELARGKGPGNVVAFADTGRQGATVVSGPGGYAARWRWGFGALAVLSVIAIASWGLRPGPRLDVPRTYQTVHGVQGVWRLSDDSVLHLDADSKVTVRYTASERRLEVDHGQALFEVAHNADRPFRVTAGATNMVAVGTEFDVSRHEHSTLLTVINGQVAVYAGTSFGAAHGLRVGAGLQVQATDEGSLSPPRSVDVHHAVAWLQRRIAFDQRPLGEVAEDFNRYNSTALVINDPALRALVVSGVFNADDLDSFTNFLASLDGVRVQRHPTAIVVTRSGAG